MKKNLKSKVAIIGLGKLGSNLFQALKETDKFNVKIAAKNSKSVIKPEITNQSEIIFICTQDRKIREVVNILSSDKFKLKKKFIYHTSGSLTSDVLEKLKNKGAFTASFHPIQTFGLRTGKSVFRNIFIAIEGSAKAVKAASAIAESLKAESFTIKKHEKILNHINCIIASNFLCAMLAKIKPLSRNRTDLEYYKALSMQTLNNIFAYGPVKSLTGPMERFDIDTIDSHLNYIKNNEELLRFYLFMGIETAKLALKKKSISSQQIKKLLEEFRKYIDGK
ncbi:MAG: DUF2520 domain-containing protein [Ignavibacteria bacterium]|nr:DUF2520 domain-containing protein [Ignavibacteria bacterium]